MANVHALQHVLRKTEKELADVRALLVAQAHAREAADTALNTIACLMDGKVWDTSVMREIADVLNHTGRAVERPDTSDEALDDLLSVVDARLVAAGYGGVDTEARRCLHDPDRFSESLDMLDDWNARCVDLGSLHAELVTLLALRS